MMDDVRDRSLEKVVSIHLHTMFALANKYAYEVINEALRYLIN